MPKLDIGIGQEFPLEEKPRTEDCAHGWHGQHHPCHHDHHHHDSLRDMWQRRFGRSDAPTDKNDKE